MRAACKVEII